MNRSIRNWLFVILVYALLLCYIVFVKHQPLNQSLLDITVFLLTLLLIVYLYGRKTVKMAEHVNWQNTSFPCPLTKEQFSQKVNELVKCKHLRMLDSVDGCFLIKDYDPWGFTNSMFYYLELSEAEHKLSIYYRFIVSGFYSRKKAAGRIAGFINSEV